MSALSLEHLGKDQDYQTIWQQMRDYTLSRTSDSPDYLWSLEHTPVFTQGQAGKAEHLLNPHKIPVVQTDRGGQITYHGPGQIVVYFLLDLQRHRMGIRQLVCDLETAMIKTLSQYDVEAARKPKAPGIYVSGAKIGSIGLRVRKGRTYHGISLNVNMDLTPFHWINPCGYAGLEMTQLSEFHPGIDTDSVRPELITQILNTLQLNTAAPAAAAPA